MTITIQIDIHAGSQWRSRIGLPGVAWLDRYGCAKDDAAAQLDAHGAVAELLRELADAILWLDRRAPDAAVPWCDALELAGALRRGAFAERAGVDPRPAT